MENPHFPVRWGKCPTRDKPPQNQRIRSPDKPRPGFALELYFGTKYAQIGVSSVYQAGDLKKSLLSRVVTNGRRRPPRRIANPPPAPPTDKQGRFSGHAPSREPQASLRSARRRVRGAEWGKEQPMGRRGGADSSQMRARRRPPVSAAASL